ncbi:MAG TPA: hypothetical protein VJZ93_02485 [Candidatus Nanoarchaeia archaeon]|nr:hypothetical protein [Candidatus Nanoarchaeia archaeon]
MRGDGNYQRSEKAMINIDDSSSNRLKTLMERAHNLEGIGPINPQKRRELNDIYYSLRNMQITGMEAYEAHQILNGKKNGNGRK